GGLGGYIAEAWGWRFGFHVFGAFGVLYSLVLLYLLRDQKQPTLATNEGNNSHEYSIKDAFKSLFQIPSYYIILFFFSALGMANWLVNGWLPTFIKEQFNLSLGDAGISATGYMQLGSFIGVIVGGIIADRWVQKNVKGRLNVILFGFCIGAPFLFLLASTGSFPLAVLAMIIFGLARGANDANLMPLLSQVVNPKYIATGYGFLNFLSTIVGGLMVYLGGALKDANVNLSVTFQFIAVFLLIAALTLRFVRIKNNN